MFFSYEDLTTVSICDKGQNDNTVTIAKYTFQYQDKLAPGSVGNSTVEIGVFSGCPDGLAVLIAGKQMRL